MQGITAVDWEYKMPSTTADILQSIGTLMAGIVSLFMLVKFYLLPKWEKRKWSDDSQKSEADSSKTFEEAAQLAAGRANRLDERLVALEAQFIAKAKDHAEGQAKLLAEINNYSTKVTELIEEIKIRDEIILQLKDWSERLVFQIQALGEKPVPFERKKPKMKPKLFPPPE